MFVALLRRLLAALVGFLPISDCNIISQKALSVLNSNDNSILGPHHQARQCAEGGLPRGESGHAQSLVEMFDIEPYSDFSAK